MSPPTPAQIRQLERVLSREPILDVSNLGFLRDNPVTDCWFAGDAAMFRGISDHEWIYIGAADTAGLGALLALLAPDERYFAAIEDWMEPVILAGRSARWRLWTRRFVLPRTVALPPLHPGSAPLRPDAAEHVHRLSEYRDLAPASYIRDRIERGPSVGIRRGDELVAWGLTHDDGALGMIHVLPEARCGGLGAAILTALAHQVRSVGGVPFSHIEENNAASVALHQRAGFVSERLVGWLER